MHHRSKKQGIHRGLRSGERKKEGFYSGGFHFFLALGLDSFYRGPSALQECISGMQWIGTWHVAIAGSELACFANLENFRVCVNKASNRVSQIETIFRTGTIGNYKEQTPFPC